MKRGKCRQQNYSIDVTSRVRRCGLTLAEVIIVFVILAVLVLLLVPGGERGSREASRRSQCKSHLKQIGIALHNYHDIYGALPPACTVGSDGRLLHSWRTLILPYLDQQDLYDMIDLSRPWNDPVNAEAYSTQLSVYVCPSSDLPECHTTYLALVGPDCAFQQGQPKRFTDVKDGMSNTLVVVDVADANAVHWMDPGDSANQFFLSFTDDTELSHAGGAHVTFADGAVKYLSAQVTTETRRALMTIAGGESVSDY